jgi:hypothetical protein
LLFLLRENGANLTITTTTETVRAGKRMKERGSDCKELQRDMIVRRPEKLFFSVVDRCFGLFVCFVVKLIHMFASSLR